MGGDGNGAMRPFFPSFRSGFCVGGGGLCLSLVLVVGGWLGLTFFEIDFFTSNTKHKK